MNIQHSMMLGLGFFLLSFSASLIRAQQYPLSCELKLEKSTIILGEPIILQYKVTNQSENRTLPDYGRRETDWCRFKILDSEGHVLPEMPDHRVKPAMTGSRLIPGNLNLRMNEFTEDKVVLSQWTDIIHPGNYRIKIHIELPDMNGSRRTQDHAELAYSGDFTLRLTVLPSSVYRLEKIAQEWTNKLSAKPTVPVKKDDQKLAIKALFSMPERVALPYWRQIVAHIDGFSEEITMEINDQLTRVGTRNAKDLLDPVGIRMRVFDKYWERMFHNKEDDSE